LCLAEINKWNALQKNKASAERITIDIQVSEMAYRHSNCVQNELQITQTNEMPYRQQSSSQNLWEIINKVAILYILNF
jgi:hypothetical protein